MSTIDRYIEIKTHRRKPVDGWHRCMHCNKIGIVTGWRRTGPSFAESLMHPVRYCTEHAVEFGAVRKEMS